MFFIFSELYQKTPRILNILNSNLPILCSRLIQDSISCNLMQLHRYLS